MPESYRYRPDQEIKQNHLSVVDNAALGRVHHLQARWDSVLSITGKKPGQFENYNPVLARAGWERMQKQDQEQQKLFKENELRNITTALRERHHTKESRISLFIDDQNKIRNEAFADEPYEAMLERGQVYREKNGSQDIQREKAEIEGFKRIQQVLTDKDTPQGTTFVVISPPSTVKETPYTHNFVDFYQAAKDEETGQRKIDYVRYASALDTDQYQQLATKLQPNFLQQKEISEEQSGVKIPMDAWYLANPFLLSREEKTVDELFSEHFADDVKAMEEETWNELDQVYLPYKLYLLDQLTKQDFDPIAIAEAYNAMLVSSKKEHHEKSAKVNVVFDAKKHKLGNDDYLRIAAFVNRHGRDQVHEVKAGCGNSGGFAFGPAPVERAPMLLNSVAQFGRKEEYFTCPDCKYEATGAIGNSCPGCGLTKEEYAAREGVDVCD